MCGGGPSGGGGNKRNKNVVSITERSFQSPGTSGAGIETGKETFKRSISRGSQSFAKGMAQLAGAMSGIPGVGTALASRIGATISTDASGRRLPGPQGRTSDSDRAGEGTALAGGKPLIPVPGQSAAQATETKRKKVSARVTGRKSTVLAGRKIAEEQLKTKLGQ